MSLEGQHIGEFEIIERLGQGGMGAVYKARQTSLKRTVALKTLQSFLAGNAEYIARFQQEAVAVNADLRKAYDALSGEGAPSVAAATAPLAAGAKPSAVLVGGAPRSLVPGKLRGALYTGLAALALVVAAILWEKTKAGNGPTAAAGPPAGVGEAVTAHGNTRPAPTTDPANATQDIPYVNILGMKFVPVPILGGPTGGWRVLFSVWDTRVQDYEVFVKETNREWPKLEFPQGPTHPAVEVSWEDAQLFCQWLTARDQSAGRLPADWRYRLPSDHEWSCAVGIGAREDAEKSPREKASFIKDAFPWGGEWPPPAGAGNYAGEELQLAWAAGKYPGIKCLITGYNDEFVNSSPVGSFSANAYGLYDMGGNVWQWCEDLFDASRKDRVLRGASWFVNSNVMSSRRLSFMSGSHVNDFGFRCVLAPAR